MQYKSFAKIENLDEYINLKALWLNNNALMKIENLGHLVNLVQLFLNNNMILKIENLDKLVNLRTLDLSHNKISKIENLQELTSLVDLDLSYNLLQNCEGLKNIVSSPSLTNVDLSFNLIEYENEDTLTIMRQLPHLACLYLQGNPFVKEFKFYRKNFVAKIPALQFLDQKPVFPNERRLAEAWMNEGAPGEEQERLKLCEEREIKNAKVLQEITSSNESAQLKRTQMVEEQEALVRQLAQQLKEASASPQLQEQVPSLSAELEKHSKILQYY